MGKRAAAAAAAAGQRDGMTHGWQRAAQVGWNDTRVAVGVPPVGQVGCIEGGGFTGSLEEAVCARLLPS
ncbi:MAG: hypothetical protein AB1816_14225, partial [Bacillota bacterium]